MGGLDAGGDKPQGKGGVGLRRPAKRVRISIDMTPFVDIAFLLLIFFMVTTVFRAPQAMEVNLPPSDAKVEVPESNVLTLYVDRNEEFFYRVGKGDVVSTTMDDLEPLFKENEKLNPELIILVKMHRNARYEIMVDVLDELEIAGMTRFSLIPMTEEDIELLGAGA
ncbi:MAG: biopolymer transporter ExbD [Candidatus Eisenbacteria bacterium]|nr:biopolymer transporter ExbD [Candidatus Latescibacterota bacterium]MBD3301619.1 biopolymer transporter ExbD [Candidatus Eisenbacteria bacterium]